MIVCTPTQREFLQNLFEECGFSRLSRAMWLRLEFHRDVTYLDDLTKAEASQAIQRLVNIKNSLKFK